MKNYFTGFRYLTGLIAINMALTLIGYAQAAQAGDATKRIRPSAGDPAAIERTVADWTRAKAFTKEYLDAMPADGITFKPSPDIRSFGQQMLHLAAGHFGFASQAAGVKPPAYDLRNLEANKEFENKEALTKIVMESYDFIMDAFKNLDASKYGEKFKLFGAFETTRLQAFDKAFEHQTHHRGQTTIYLRLKGVKPPNEKLF